MMFRKRTIHFEEELTYNNFTLPYSKKSMANNARLSHLALAIQKILETFSSFYILMKTFLISMYRIMLKFSPTLTPLFHDS